MNPKIILLAIPFFFLLILIELLIGKRRNRLIYRLNDAITNLNIGIGQQAVNLLLKGGLFTAFVFLFEKLSIFHLPANVWTFLLCLVLFDFLFYWAHRWSHEINFWWGAHVVHHSSEEYNLSVALRQSWFHNLLAFFIFIPLPVLGFSPELLLLAGGIHTVYQFWIHTRLIGKLPSWIEYIFNTPSHHRVHHGRNPKYIDKNHGGVFIIFDRLFGTFAEEEEEPVYGITTPLRSWNPGWANIHYYVEMGRAMKKMKWKDRLKMPFARPGWLPDYLGGYQAPPEISNQSRHKYDRSASFPLTLYILFNFALISLGVSALMFFFDDLSTFFKIIFVTNILLSILICGAIFEQRKWVIFTEYVRLTLVLISLNLLYYEAYLDWFTIMLIASSAGFAILAIWFTLSWRVFGWKKQPRLD